MLKSIRHAAENPATVCKLVTSSAESILKSQFALTKYEISVLEGHGFRHILPECDEHISIPNDPARRGEAAAKTGKSCLPSEMRSLFTGVQKIQFKIESIHFNI